MSPITITLSVSRVLQGILILLHILNYVLPFVPPKFHMPITVAIGVGNILVNELAHNSTPAGEPIPPAQPQPQNPK